MFVSQSEIEVPLERVAELETAFAARSRLVDGHEGFLGLELFRDVGSPGRFILLTRWTNRACFKAYMRSADFKLAHQREHHGLEVANGGAPLRQFECVALG